MAGRNANGPQVHLPFPPERFLPYLTTTDIAALPKDDALVILPIASIEQHGPHLPIASDTILGLTILGRALERLGPDVRAWVLPGLAYGKSNEHRGFAGTISLSQATLAAVVGDVAQGVADAGFRRLALVNSHGGNPPVLTYVARDVRQRTGLMVFPLFMFAMGVDYGEVSDEEAHWGTHAGEWETSALLALAPDLVHLDRAAQQAGAYPRYRSNIRHLTLRGSVTYAWLTSDVAATGTAGDPSLASLEHGERIIEATIVRLAEVLAEMTAFEMPIPAGSDE
jgi:creatinine amidohydrolase/Fe(II)-dependent formamide hydrolase-like protein